MLIVDILHSCSNDRVAAAAVASLGPAFSDRVAAAARRSGMTTGAFVSAIVKRFAAEAGEREWRAVVALVKGADQPVLAGLKFIVARAVSDTEASPNQQSGEAAGGGWARPQLDVTTASAFPCW